MLEDTLKLYMNGRCYMSVKEYNCVELGVIASLLYGPLYCLLNGYFGLGIISIKLKLEPKFLLALP